MKLKKDLSIITCYQNVIKHNNYEYMMKPILRSIIIKKTLISTRRFYSYNNNNNNNKNNNNDNNNNKININIIETYKNLVISEKISYDENQFKLLKIINNINNNKNNNNNLLCTSNIKEWK